MAFPEPWAFNAPNYAESAPGSSDLNFNIRIPLLLSVAAYLRAYTTIGTLVP